jgi:anti-sigma B factor antagonist
VALSLETRAERDRTVVVIKGDLEVGTTPQLRAHLAGLGTHDVIVDLTGLRFLDSTGLGVLVGAQKRARARRCSLQLVCPGGPIREVLAMTGLTRVFEIHCALDAVPHRPRRVPSGPG